MPGSVRLWALLLSGAAIVAMFRLGWGMLQTLAATSAAGIALYAAGVITA
jgi:chromate transporter